MALAQLHHAGSSWLVQRCGPLPSCCSLSSNVQLVPAICLNLPPLVKRVNVSASRGQTRCLTAVSSSATPVVSEDATEARLYMLYEFVHQHNRLPKVHEQHKSVAVGRWSEQCKLQHQEQRLEAGLVEALQSIPGWTWRSKVRNLATEVAEAVDILQQYHRKHRRMPRMRHTVRSAAPDPEQAAATAAIQKMYDFRKRGLLTSQQIEFISNSVPAWKWDSRVRAAPLEILLQQLQEFADTHGRLPKQHEKLSDGFLIGEWCSMRRSDYNNGELQPDVADTIAAGVVGWTWNLYDTAFEEGLEILKSFVAEHKRMPSQRDSHDGFRIGAWINKRRLQYKHGQMSSDRVAALEAVEGWWWTADDMPLQ